MAPIRWTPLATIHCSLSGKASLQVDRLCSTKASTYILLNFIVKKVNTEAMVVVLCRRYSKQMTQRHRKRERWWNKRKATKIRAGKKNNKEIISNSHKMNANPILEQWQYLSEGRNYEENRVSFWYFTFTRNKLKLGRENHMPWIHLLRKPDGTNNSRIFSLCKPRTEV